MESSRTPFEPDLSKWEAWTPEEVHGRLAEIGARWYVAAGWAIDLFLGEERRAHDDIEIAVSAARFDEIAAAFPELEFFVVGDGLAWPLDERDAHHQTWGRDRATGRWRLDVFREPSDGHMWICRRDERIRLPYDEVIERTSAGIPFARPEIVLLFKARAARAKDDDDFDAVLPHLDTERRRWLRRALELVHPGHRWLAELG